MSAAFDIPEGEFGVVRVFEVALDAPDEQARFLAGADTPDWPVAVALHTDPEVPLRRDYIDAIPASGLTGVGLVSYLADGVGVRAADLDGLRARLEGIERPVVIVLSKAFGGAATRLHPREPLRWIGTFGETRATPVTQQTRVVEGHVAPAAAAKGQGGNGRLMMWAGIIALAAVVLAAVIFWMGSSAT